MRIEQTKNVFPYLIILFLTFYLLPFMMKDTGSAMIIILVIIPCICFLCSFFYGIKNSFHWLYSLIVVILFTPTIFIFYNLSAWVYIIGYGFIAVIGNFLGMMLHKKKEKRGSNT